MNHQTHQQVTATNYGKTTFITTIVTITISVGPTWALMPYIYTALMLVGPLLLLTILGGSIVASLSTGTTAQIARGMAIGSITAPLSILIFGGTYILAEIAGLL